MKQKFSFPIQTGEYTQTPPNTHHDGMDSLDFAIVEGTPLHAIADGKIILARKDRNQNTYEQGQTSDTGNCVVLEFNATGGTFYATYMHMKTVSVQEGDIVASGQVIGTSGNTGYSNGAHLHFQIRKDSGFSGQVQRDYNLAKEKFRLIPTSSTIGFTHKLFRYLEVQKNEGTKPVDSPFIPTEKVNNYYKENFNPSLLSEDDLSRLCQLCIDELGIIGDKNTQLMNFGLYAKLMRCMYMKYRITGEKIIQVLKDHGGFSGWGTRNGGYPLLSKSYPYQNEIKEMVYNNLMKGEIFGMTGKFYKMASCYPLQNYGYAGLGYSNPTRTIEKELESKIVNRQIKSHITINSGTTRLIGCIANTGFFTTEDVISNLSDVSIENKILIDQI